MLHWLAVDNAVNLSASSKHAQPRPISLLTDFLKLDRGQLEKLNMRVHRIIILIMSMKIAVSLPANVPISIRLRFVKDSGMFLSIHFLRRASNLHGSVLTGSVHCGQHIFLSRWLLVLGLMLSCIFMRSCASCFCHLVRPMPTNVCLSSC